MKRTLIACACLLALLLLAPRLEAQPPDPAQALSTPFAGTCAAPTAPTLQAGSMAAPALDLFNPSPKPATCTFAQCTADCTDCPWGCTKYCVNWTLCYCGCRCP